jgi:hypothetical protein
MKERRLSMGERLEVVRSSRVHESYAWALKTRDRKAVEFRLGEGAFANRDCQ